MNLDFPHLQNLYNKQMNLLLAKNGLTTKCLLTYETGKKDLCPNCIYDPSSKKSANKYKIGGPQPFVIGRICPYCNGAGYYGSDSVEEVYLAVIWDYKYWINKPINVAVPDGFIQTICSRDLLSKIKKAKAMTVVVSETNSNPLFRLSEEPDFNGLGDNNYLICNWERNGISSVSRPSSPSPVINEIINTANLHTSPAHLMTSVGKNGGSSFYGTYDQTGNAEEWTESIHTSNALGLQVKVAGGYSGPNTNAISKDTSIYGTLTSRARYRGFRIATTNNPNSYLNFVPVKDSENAADTNGYGRVDYDYMIGKYEVTYEEWCEFMNAVASYTTDSSLATNLDISGTNIGSYGGSPVVTSDTYGLLNGSFLSRVEIIPPTTFPGSYRYEIKPQFKDKPVTNISWENALRYTNWLHNGKPIGYQTVNNDGATPNPATTERGAYVIDGITASITPIYPEPRAKYRLPSIDEWYKAAYYNPGIRTLDCDNSSAVNAFYTSYATQSNDAPVNSNNTDVDSIALILSYSELLAVNPPDNNITLPLSGPLDVAIDMGYGTWQYYDTDGQVTYNMPVGQQSTGYTVKIVGNLPHLNNALSFTRDAFGNVESQSYKLTRIKSFGDVGLKSLDSFARGALALREAPSYLPSTVTSLYSTFQFILASSLPNISQWDTSRITDMSYCFNTSFNFNQDLSNWNVSNVRDMKHMFYGTAFNQDISNWNVSSVEDMTYMFGLSDFNQNINSWNTSSVQDLTGIFFGASDFNQPLSNWDVSKVTSLEYAFYGTQFNQNINSWNTSSLTNLRTAFLLTPFNQPLNNWDVSNVTDLFRTFSQSDFNQNINNWNVSKVTNMIETFSSSDFNQFIGSWDVSSVTSMAGLFRNTLFNQNLSNWNVSNVIDMSSMFHFAYDFNQDISSWNVSNVTNMSNMFQDAQDFNQNLSSWCVTNIAFKPTLFDSGANSWVLAQPIWGTCP